MNELKSGDVIKTPYPFVLSSFEDFSKDGQFSVPTWKPGTEIRGTPGGYSEGRYDSGDREYCADGEGFIVLTVVDIHKPGKYPTRVFFTRSWITPQGKAFGKPLLRITSLPIFRRLTQGYRWSVVSDRNSVLESAGRLARTLGIETSVLLKQVGISDGGAP